jgi:hypothetical protein
MVLLFPSRLLLPNSRTRPNSFQRWTKLSIFSKVMLKVMKAKAEGKAEGNAEGKAEERVGSSLRACVGEAIHSSTAFAQNTLELAFRDGENTAASSSSKQKAARCSLRARNSISALLLDTDPDAVVASTAQPVDDDDVLAEVMESFWSKLLIDDGSVVDLDAIADAAAGVADNDDADDDKDDEEVNDDNGANDDSGRKVFNVSRSLVVEVLKGKKRVAEVADFQAVMSLLLDVFFDNVWKNSTHWVQLFCERETHASQFAINSTVLGERHTDFAVFAGSGKRAEQFGGRQQASALFVGELKRIPKPKVSKQSKKSKELNDSRLLEKERLIDRAVGQVKRDFANVAKFATPGPLAPVLFGMCGAPSQFVLVKLFHSFGNTNSLVVEYVDVKPTPPSAENVDLNGVATKWLDLFGKNQAAAISLIKPLHTVISAAVAKKCAEYAAIAASTAAASASTATSVSLSATPVGHRWLLPEPLCC